MRSTDVSRRLFATKPRYGPRGTGRTFLLAADDATCTGASKPKPQRHVHSTSSPWHRVQQRPADSGANDRFARAQSLKASNPTILRRAQARRRERTSTSGLPRTAESKHCVRMTRAVAVTTSHQRLVAPRRRKQTKFTKTWPKRQVQTPARVLFLPYSVHHRARSRNTTTCPRVVGGTKICAHVIVCTVLSGTSVAPLSQMRSLSFQNTVSLPVPVLAIIPALARYAGTA